MTPEEIIADYKKAYFDLYGKTIEVMRKGSWYYVGDHRFHAHRLKRLPAMAQTLRERKQV